ncbi:hypothetical protein [Roseovarius dicentrarchi]|uniref:hypothetical protein n=1 Tax=Roseovarius dicentrarchi TaxID=2250573 RepID=UPI0013966C07|nr:hypothetical protein [Roseovarius dicentrarchi]
MDCCIFGDVSCDVAVAAEGLSAGGVPLDPKGVEEVDFGSDGLSVDGLVEVSAAESVPEAAGTAAAPAGADAVLPVSTSFALSVPVSEAAAPVDEVAAVLLVWGLSV